MRYFSTMDNTKSKGVQQTCRVVCQHLLSMQRCANARAANKAQKAATDETTHLRFNQAMTRMAPAMSFQKQVLRNAPVV